MGLSFVRELELTLGMNINLENAHKFWGRKEMSWEARPFSYLTGMDISILPKLYLPFKIQLKQHHFYRTIPKTFITSAF